MLRIGFLPGALGIVAFGLTLPLTRIAVSATSPVDVFVLRLLLASATAVLVLLLFRVSIPPRQHWRDLLLVSLGVVFGFPLFTSLAMNSEAAAHGGVVLGILPLATAVAGTLLNHERPTTLFWMAAVAGSVLVVVYSLLGGAGSVSAGDGWLLLAIVSAAVGYVVGARLAAVMPAWQVISWALAIALPAGLSLIPLLAVSIDDIVTPAALGYPVLFALLYLGLISQYGGFLLWYRALAIDGVARTSQIQLFQPFITIVAAAVLLGERIGLLTIVFALLILATVLLSRRSLVNMQANT